MAKLDLIGTVKSCLAHDEGACTLVVNDGKKDQTVECEAGAARGWFPDKDDVVRIFKKSKIFVVEPVDWSDGMKDEEREEKCIEKMERRQEKRAIEQKRQKEIEDFEKKKKAENEAAQREIEKQKKTEKVIQ